MAVLDGISGLTSAGSLSRKLLDAYAGDFYVLAGGSNIDYVLDQVNDGHWRSSGGSGYAQLSSAGPNSRASAEVGNSTTGFLLGDFETLADLISSSTGYVVFSYMVLEYQTDSANSYNNQAIWLDVGGFAGATMKTTGPTILSYNWDGSDDHSDVTGPSTNAVATHEWRHESGVIYGRANGGSWSSGTASGNTTTLTSAVRLGSNLQTNTFIKIFEWAFFNSVPSSADQDTIANNFYEWVFGETQYMRPSADSSDGGWTNEQGGTTLFSSIDEVSPDDADYIKSSDNPSNDACTIEFSNPASPVIEPFGVDYRYKGFGTADLAISLMQGTTQIAQWTHTSIGTTFTTVGQTLTTTQFASITDFNDLLFKAAATGSGSSAVTIASTANPAGAGVGTTITYSTVSIGTAGTERMVVVPVGAELASGFPGTATINYGLGAQTMSSTAIASVGAVYARIFYLGVPTGTTADIAITFGTNQATATQHLAVYSMVGGTFSSAGVVGDTDADPISSGQITIPTNGACLAVCVDAVDTTARTWTGVTEDIDEDAGSFRFGTGLSTTAGTPTITVSGANAEDGALAWLILGPMGRTYVSWAQASAGVGTAVVSQNKFLSLISVGT